ncbi:MAG: 30S ribosomal protein S6 [Desulfobacteraceae bacterium]|jgi:small subunit ribosomal protein S6
MKQYETIFIVNPNLGEEQYSEVTKKFSNLIEKQKGVLVRVEEWGSQRLAYGVKKFDKGAYLLMLYCGQPGLTAELERELKLDDRVLKYQTVKLADKVDPQALILKEKEAKKSVITEEERGLEGAEAVQGEEEKASEEVSSHG